MFSSGASLPHCAAWQTRGEHQEFLWLSKLFLVLPLEHLGQSREAAPSDETMIDEKTSNYDRQSFWSWRNGDPRNQYYLKRNKSWNVIITPKEIDLMAWLKSASLGIPLLSFFSLFPSVSSFFLRLSRLSSFPLNHYCYCCCYCSCPSSLRFQLCFFANGLHEIFAYVCENQLSLVTF